MTTNDVTPKPITTRKKLQPFGGINAKAGLQNIKEEALRTLSRQECFEKGFLTVKDLDDEELRYGKCRDHTGKIPNNSKYDKTELIPKERYDEMVAEHELRYKQKLRQRLDAMLDIMTDIAMDDTVEPRDRFEAAKYLFERTAGKTPDTVNVNIKAAPWEDMFNQVAGIAPMTRAQHREMQAQALQTGIVDVEYEEQDGEEADPQDKNQHEVRQDDDEEAVQQDVPPVYQPDMAETAAAGADSEDSTGEPEAPADQFAHLDPHEQYGRRADEARTYQRQVKDAAELVRRRKEHKKRIQDAKKQRKIARATGADAIKDEITGVTLSDDGQITFNTE